MTRAALAILLPALVLPGCVQVDAVRDASFARATHECMAINPGFTEAWGCIRQRITREDIGTEDAERAKLKELGDALTEQLAGEALSSAEARSRLSAALPP